MRKYIFLYADMNIHTEKSIVYIFNTYTAFFKEIHTNKMFTYYRSFSL